MHGHGDGPHDSLSRHAALTVAVVAAFLAIATFLGNESVKEAIQGQTKVSDAHSQQTTFDTQDEIFQSDQALFSVFEQADDQGLSSTSKLASKALRGTAKKVPAERKRLEETLKESKHDVKHANDQHLRYELAEVLLQIAIVLASVAIIARRRFLLFGGHGLAAAGIVVLVVGYTT
ncbi:MAG: hypothetical protein QOE06_477 [Thermoleophilaceae bacterium]|nr:hypothetical protein [Thermoleophilaceae bacterium]